MAASLFMDHAKQGEAEMELMQLEMLVAVAEEHSFLRAAERVFRTQPAVSIGIRKLEGRVGVPLLDRSSGRTGRLTPAGERLYEYAQKILGLRDEALSVVNEQENVGDRTLRVGLVGEASLNRFPTLWKSFKESCPRVHVKLLSDSLGAVLNELTGGHLDVAVLSGRPRTGALSKNLVATRLRNVSGYGWLWVVRPRHGKSSLAHAFERTALQIVPARARLSRSKRITLPRLRVVR
jgi:DNA-binding transcriptional LysR family regulator